MSSEVPLPLASPKQNNFLQNGENIIQHMKYLFILESFLGVNRLYLCGYRKFILWSSYVFSITLLLFVGIYLLHTGFFTATQHVFKNTSSIEYLLLGFNAWLLQKNNLFHLFSIFQTFDEKLSIDNEVFPLTPKRWYYYGISAVLLYNMVEILFCVFFVFYNYNKALFHFIIFIPAVIHDLEIVFFSYLFALVLRRLCLIKAHVANVFSDKITETDAKDISNVEVLVKKICLDVSSLHNAYDLLHKASETINYIMSAPMLVMLIATGTSSIMLLKNTLAVIQASSVAISPDIAKSMVIFTIGRCIKNTVLLIVPCFISNKTNGQVARIRSMIYDNLNSNRIVSNKLERRKLKAFLYLTRENDFTYALWGVVTLDMSFPLSYSSLCITYLIIVVQFSKFFD